MFCWVMSLFSNHTALANSCSQKGILNWSKQIMWRLMKLLKAPWTLILTKVEEFPVVSCCLHFSFSLFSFLIQFRRIHPCITFGWFHKHKISASSHTEEKRLVQSTLDGSLSVIGNWVWICKISTGHNIFQKGQSK